jgi:hypothetical protein
MAQHCHPHGHTHLALLKIKKYPSHSSRITIASASILELTLESAPCPHRRGVLHRDHDADGRNMATCCTTPERRRLAFLCPHRHLPLTAEFFEPTQRGSRRLLRRNVLHRAQPLTCRHPPSPLHLSAACWQSQFPTR